MDAAQWHQLQQVANLSRPMEAIPIPIPNNNSNNNNSRASKPILEDQRTTTISQKDQKNINCPRCNSTNTKFCYYNNYSPTQPRYFCKACKRYWTHGGSLRNVPVGGASRKNKRSSSSPSPSPSSSSSILTIANPNSIPNNLNPLISSLPQHLIIDSHQNPNKFLEGHDLNLGFPIQGIFQPINENHEPINGGKNNTSTSISATIELLRTEIASRGSLNYPYVPFSMPNLNSLCPSGFPYLQDFKPNMVGLGDNGGGARVLFPFADMKKLAITTPSTGDDASTTPTHHHHHHEIDHDDQINGENDDHQGPKTGYWSGM